VGLSPPVFLPSSVTATVTKAPAGAKVTSTLFNWKVRYSGPCVSASNSINISSRDDQKMMKAVGTSRRIPIDHSFRSLADDQGGRDICIILSGTGTDGTTGIRATEVISDGTLDIGAFPACPGNELWWVLRAIGALPPLTLHTRRWPSGSDKSLWLERVMRAAIRGEGE